MARNEPTLAEKSQTIRTYIKSEPPKGKPKWPHTYHVMNSRGKRVVLRQVTKDGVVEVPYKDELASDLFRYSEELGLSMTFKQCEGVAEDWTHTQDIIPEPAYLRPLSEPGLTFRRLPFDYLDRDFHCPTFDGWCERMGKMALSFQCWVGSTLFDDSDVSQYPYLQGQGRDGKSVFISCLEELFGQAFLSTQPPCSGGKRFWTKSLVGKRVVVFPDSSDPKFPSDTLFKILTGADTVQIEGKGEDQYNAKLKPKFLFASNDEIDLLPQACDIRRVLYIPMEPYQGKDDPNFKSQLMGEAQHWLSKCRALYIEHCSETKKIPTTEDNASLATAAAVDEYERVIHKHLIIDASGWCYATHFLDRLNHESDGKYKRNIEKSKLYRYLKDEYGVTREIPTAGDRRTKLHGARIKFYAYSKDEKSVRAETRFEDQI